MARESALYVKRLSMAKENTSHTSRNFIKTTKLKKKKPFSVVPPVTTPLMENIFFRNMIKSTTALTTYTVTNVTTKQNLKSISANIRRKNMTAAFRNSNVTNVIINVQGVII